MPNESTKSAETKETGFVFNKKAVDEHVQSILTHLSQFNGKPNHNPHTWIHHNLTQLNNRLEDGNRSKELQDAIMNLPAKPSCVINPELVGEVVKEIPQIQLASPKKI